MAARRGRAVGCGFAVDRGDFDTVVALFRDRERVFSRFDPASEIDRVNAAPADIVGVWPSSRALRRRWRELRHDGRLLWRPAGVTCRTLHAGGVALVNGAWRAATSKEALKTSSAAA